MKEKAKLYDNHDVGCKSRQGNLTKLFSHENHEYLLSLCEYGKIRKQIRKIDFVICLSIPYSNLLSRE